MSRYKRCIMPEYVEEKEDVSGNADESWQVGQPLDPPGKKSRSKICRLTRQLMAVPNTVHRQHAACRNI